MTTKTRKGMSPQEIFRTKTRNPNRIRSSDLVKLIFSKIEYFESKDHALICGIGYWGKKSILFIGQEKPKGNDIAYARKVNFGMVRPEGYRYAIELLRHAEEKKLPVITFCDTPGADPSNDSASRLQSWAISDCITAFCTVRTPTVSLLLGEGGSGGALALQVTDRRLMMEDAMYYVIAPESCGSILFRDNSKISESIELLRPTSAEILHFNIIDEIIREPEDVEDHHEYAKAIKPRLMHALHEIEKIDLEKLLERRRQRVLAFGVLKKHGFFSAVSEFFLRAPRQNHRTAKAKVIEAANLRDSLEMAYLQSRNIDLSKPHVHCEKEDGRGCGSFIPLEEYLDNFKSCPTCGKGEPLSPYEWVDILCDGNSFRESNANLTARDLIRDEDLRTDYTSLLEKMEKKSGSGEALVTGVGSINGYECVLMISDFNFIGGSMGSAMGEKIARAVQYCLEERLPLISVCSSGGARMHEGTISLMQMAKTNMAIAMLKEDHLPYISLLAHPCTGGALASYATQGTINLSEENALIAFAGPRVTELAGIKVDPEFINSAFVLRKGGIDEIVPRSRLRQVITRYLKFYAQTH